MVTVTLDISLADCRNLYQAVTDALETWPGSPARPPEQQENYRHLKLFLFSILCEASLDT
jgi:hypothetical protein